MLIDPLDAPAEVRDADHVLVTVYWHGRTTREADPKRVWASTLHSPCATAGST